MQKENRALWNVKHLLTKLVGDQTWAPCEMFLGPNDIELYRDDYIDYVGQAQGSVKSDGNTLSLEGAHPKSSNKNEEMAARVQAPSGTSANANTNGNTPGDIDIPMVDVEPPAEVDRTALELVTQNGKAVVEGQKEDTESNERNGVLHRLEGKDARGNATEDHQSAAADASNGTTEPHNTKTTAANSLVASAGQGETDSKAIQDNQVSREAEHGVSRAVSVMSEFTDDPPIHPLFLAPRSAHPDRDLGLPEAEAEDMRRLLQLYVQKQEEVCRGAKRLYEGLLRADRLRKTVLQWTKYEAHVGPHRDLSDGEDWYDKEEWGLEEDLKKGQDEEEEDTTQTTKKTRTRR